MTDFDVVTIHNKEVVNYETGEIIKPASNLTIKTRLSCPFRSVTDLKGFNDNEVNTHDSLTNADDYVSVKKLIDMIFRGKTLQERQILMAQMNAQHAEDFDEDNEVEIIEDLIEQSDDLADISANYEQAEQISSQTAHADSEQSAGKATTTAGGGANAEAANADRAVE